MKIWDDDPGVVPSFAADDLAAAKGIDAPKSGLDGQPAVDRARFEIGEVLAGQIGTGGPCRLPY